MKSLLQIKGTLPFLMIIFLNAFVDLGHKITIQNTVFKVYDGGYQVILTALVNALILLPFIMLFTPSGYVSDKYPKTSVMKISALVAVVITSLITVSYWLGWFWVAFAMTFLLAVQSAFYGPAKLGYIKVLYGESNLTEANGITQATTMVAILLGTFVFSIFFESLYSESLTNESAILKNLWWVGLLLVLFSLLEWWLVSFLPVKENVNEQLSFDKSEYMRGRLLYRNVQMINLDKIILWSILGICVFWSAGQVMLAAFPAFVKEQVGLTNTVVLQLILASSGIGIMAGAILTGRLSQGFINTRLIPIGAVGITIGLLILPFLNNLVMMALVFVSVGFAGGLFVVPLNALIQFNAKSSHLGSVLAGKNFFQNIFMLSFLILTAIFAYYGLSSQQLLLWLAAFVVIGGVVVVTCLKKALNQAVK